MNLLLKTIKNIHEAYNEARDYPDRYSWNKTFNEYDGYPDDYVGIRAMAMKLIDSVHLSSKGETVMKPAGYMLNPKGSLLKDKINVNVNEIGIKFDHNHFLFKDHSYGVHHYTLRVVLECPVTRKMFFVLEWPREGYLDDIYIVEDTQYIDGEDADGLYDALKWFVEMGLNL